MVLKCASKRQPERIQHSESNENSEFLLPQPHAIAFELVKLQVTLCTFEKSVGISKHIDTCTFGSKLLFSCVFVSVLSCVHVDVAVMFSFRAMVLLPVEQDMESESDLKAFAVVPTKKACCMTPPTDFVLHIAAHHMSTEQRVKTESDVWKEMGELLTDRSAKARMFSRKCAEFFKSHAASSAFTGFKEYRESLFSSSSVKVDEPVSLYNLAIISGMHIAVFFQVHGLDNTRCQRRSGVFFKICGDARRAMGGVG